MSRRTHKTNAFQAQLAALITASANSIELTSTVLLSAPGYGTIDHDNIALTEWVRYEGIAGNTLTGVTRGLQGASGTGIAIEHAQGAIFRQTYTAQDQDDIFSDIEDLEDAATDHAAAANPHPGYATDADVAAVQAELDATQVTLAATQADLDTAEAAIDVLEAAPIQTPTGAIVMWYDAGGLGLPDGWLLCDGAPIPAEFTELMAIVGGPNTPNLVGRFPFGANLQVDVGETGGQFDHIHSVSAHDHTGSTGSGGSHNHGNIGGATSNVPSGSGARQYVHNASGERHTHDVVADGVHEHTIPTEPSVFTSEENPPYIGINFIIKT